MVRATGVVEVMAIANVDDLIVGAVHDENRVSDLADLLYSWTENLVEKEVFHFWKNYTSATCQRANQDNANGGKSCC